MAERIARFPSGFAWGTASSSHQSEGGNLHNDWWAWEEQPGRIARGDRSGRANDFWHRYDDDFRLLAELGLRHVRLSVEWSRIEPDADRVDATALAHYQRILEAARARGLTVWVNLHHFALPRWYAARGGFSLEANLAPWRRHVARVVRALGPLAGHWHPINEANAYAGGSYLLGLMPPGERDLGAFVTVLRNTMLAYRDAFATVKAIDPALQVGPIHAMMPAFPADPDSEADQFLAASFDALFNAVPLHALAEGELRLPGRDPEPVADLRGAADFFGLNYYAAATVDHRRPDDRLPYPLAAPRLTQLGNAPWPDGLRQSLHRLRALDLGVPLYVTENGIGTDDDAWRVRYIRDHLSTVAQAIAEGCDVRGYFHWTAVDNFEWHLGWTAQFGLIAFDPESLARVPRPSAFALAATARANALALADAPS